MKPNDPLEEPAKLVVDAYNYALSNKLDISDKADVEKLLQVLDPEHASDMDLEDFMMMLDTLDKLTRNRIAKKENDK